MVEPFATHRYDNVTQLDLKADKRFITGGPH